MRLIFLDTETPNRYNERICSIGIVVREDKKVLFEKSWLVNPETNFDALNMEIHNISKQDILDAPVFPDVWEEILSWSNDNTVFVMHNARFDLNVINKTLSAYDIHMCGISYYCTMAKCLSSRLFSSAKLDEVMGAINKEFTHHEALSDAKACSEVYDYLDKKLGWQEADLNFFESERIYTGASKYGSDFYHAIKNLEGLLLGIVSDGIIQDKEVEDLKKWVADNECNRSKLGFKECLDMMSRELEHTIDVPKCRDMYEWLFNHEENCHENTYAREEWRGILRGIIADGAILLEELNYLLDWREQHHWIDSGTDRIYEACMKAFSLMKSGEFTEIENQKLIELLRAEFTDECSDNVFLDFHNKVCCLTGTFVNGLKGELEARIEKAGGFCTSSVTKRTNYVFVGGEGSRKYYAGNYGTKIRRALELKSMGQNINIFEEKILIASLKHLNA